MQNEIFKLQGQIIIWFSLWLTWVSLKYSYKNDQTEEVISMYHFLLWIGLILYMYKCTRESNYLQFVYLDYGKKKDNPIDHAVFYNKENRDKPLNIKKKEVICFKLKWSNT